MVGAMFVRMIRMTRPSPTVLETMGQAACAAARQRQRTWHPMRPMALKPLCDQHAVHVASRSNGGGSRNFFPSLSAMMSCIELTLASVRKHCNNNAFSCKLHLASRIGPVEAVNPSGRTERSERPERSRAARNGRSPELQSWKRKLLRCPQRFRWICLVVMGTNRSLGWLNVLRSIIDPWRWLTGTRQRHVEPATKCTR